MKDKKSSNIWFLTQEELRNQAENYDSLKPQKSARGIAVIYLFLWLVFNIFIYWLSPQLVLTDTLIIGIIILSALTGLVYCGYRSAAYLLILILSLNLIINYALTLSVAALFLGGLFSWLFPVSFLLKAIHVENYRKKNLSQTERGNTTQTPVTAKENNDSQNDLHKSASASAKKVLEILL